MGDNIFEQLLDEPSLFKNREVLHHGFTPSALPHREREINTLVHNLVEALQGQIPSNMLLYGQPGSGKTAVTRFVSKQLLARGAELGRTVHVVEVNCCTVDTKYRVLAQIGNSLSRKGQSAIPFTGWPTDKVLERLKENMDAIGGVHVIVLDEVDHLVHKSGDGVLYPLTSLNYELQNSRCCIIGITNDLLFPDMLDARVASRLGSEDLVFSPYNAAQIEDVLSARAKEGIKEGVLDDGIIELCAALSAQEHGDARRALDLLRISVQKAEHDKSENVNVQHVRLAQNQLEFDQITPVIATLTAHQKLVLYSVLLNERNGLRNVSTGEVYTVYQMTCANAGLNPLTSRRVSDLILILDALNLVTAKTISLGREGRSKRINSCIPDMVDPIKVMLEADDSIKSAIEAQYRLQARLG